VVAAGADEPPKDPAVKQKAVQAELAKFAGIWRMRTEGGTGEARFAVFRKDGRYSTYDKNGMELWSGTFDLDPTANPKVWDHREDGEPKKTGRDILGIYELDGDKLRVCLTIGRWVDGKWKGEPRPSEFKEGASYTVLEFQRVKK
jgi:uncharacterized protein (TIGR03067 family)